MRKNRLFRIIIVFISIFVLAKFSMGALDKKANSDELYKQIELFSDAISYVRLNYVEEVSAKDLIYGALKGMLAALDPYSQFMNPESFKEIMIETKGQFGGVGIEISIRDGLLTIISPLEDTPAHKAGIKPNDRIVKIDDVSTKNITLMEAVKKLRGKAGAVVKLTILRENEGRIFDVDITRDIIKIVSIKDASVLGDNVGYIRLTEFQERTHDDLAKALKKMEKDGMDSLILDLRNNPGGLLDSAVKVSDIFLAKGKVIVTIRGRTEKQEVQYKSKSVSGTDYPMVILINGGSASASEIVAGAVQDNGRGIIMGTKSFGKGSVQTVIPLKDKSALRLTTAKYFTPSGRAIREEGIIPDVVVEYQKLEKTDEVEKKVEEVFEKVEEEGEKKKVYDNQMLRAIDLLKGIKAYNRLEIKQ